MVPKSPSEVRSWLDEAHTRLLSCIPPKVGDHLVAAKKELLSAARAILDEEVGRTDERWKDAKSRKTAREKQTAEEE